VALPSSTGLVLMAASIPAGDTSPADEWPVATRHAHAAGSALMRIIRHLAWVMLLTECAGAAASAPLRGSAPPHPNIVLITLDTTRADLTVGLRRISMRWPARP
jgi:hypothetical protein